MGKIFTTDTSDTINVAMTVQADCFDDRYTAEVQSADLKVWNEKERIFCSVEVILEILDTEDPRNTMLLLVKEDKIGLPSLSTQIAYRGNSSFISVESFTAESEQSKENIKDAIDRWLKIDVRIEGI